MKLYEDNNVKSNKTAICNNQYVLPGLQFFAQLNLPIFQ